MVKTKSTSLLVLEIIDIDINIDINYISINLSTVTQAIQSYKTFGVTSFYTFGKSWELR